ncbi:MAG TPA: 2-hydroxychromene-2-carboxylate isomerase [Sphingomonas sp.]|jgi:2-hydroxychromene-2-carboxylate isomerase
MMDVTFYFDFGSPNAFLAHRVTPGIEARTGTRFDYVPILLGGLFKLAGNQSPVTAFAGIKNKRDYDALEMRRFIARHSIGDFAFNPHFPINTLHLMRGAIAAQQLGVFELYVDRIYDAMWARGLDMGQTDIVARTLAEAGLPVERLLALSQSPDVKQRLLDNTQAAFEKGAFGSPTFLVGDELYFGKDRLRDVEEAIGVAYNGGPQSGIPLHDWI